MARPSHRRPRPSSTVHEPGDEHPPEIRDRIRYTSGPSMWTQAFFERQSAITPLPAPRGSLRRWRALAGLLSATCVVTGATAAWRALDGRDGGAWVGVAWLLLAITVLAYGRVWYLTD